MNRRTVFLAAAVIQVLLPTGLLHAGSIWAKRDPKARMPYTDEVARRIGDTLTIVIAEQSKVDNKAKRDLQKETARSSEFDGKLNVERVLERIPGFTMEAQSSNELKAKADFKDERSFEDRVTVVVLDILPNGNLVVLGTRDRNIAGDVQTIEISGIVRPSDVSYDNSVRSERVANFRIVSKNAGVSAPFMRPGWLGRIFDIFWPW
jgi:flagellar L-ring protein precursor FlgH